MSKILVRRSHSLTHEQARRVANAVAEELTSEYGIEATWRGDTLHFERSSLSGRLELGSGELVLEVTLGFFLAAFRNRIAQAIETKLEVMLAEPQPLAANKVATIKEKSKRSEH